MILLVVAMYLLAPIDAKSVSIESLLDNYDDRFVDVTMFVMRNKSDHPSSLLIKADNRFESKCSVPEVFSSSWKARALSAKSVLVWLDDYSSRDGKNQAKLILVNVRNCKYQTIYLGALSEKYEIYTSISPSDEKFTLIMRGKDYCQGQDWCRLHFDPLYQKLQPFDFDFPADQLDDIHSAMTSNPNLFVVSHTDDTNTRRIRLYDLSNDQTILEYKELLALPNYNSLVNNTRLAHYPVESMDLSLCWGNLTLDSEINFYCSEFTEDGDVALSLTVSYPDSVVASHFVKILPSKFLIGLVFEHFDERDLSTLPEEIVGFANMIKGMKNMSENSDDPRWKRMLDSFSSECHRNALVYIESD